MTTRSGVPDSLSRSGAVGSSVSLAQLRAGNVRIEWFEAVAVMAALCHAVVETADERQSLTADTVFLFENGSVSALVGVTPPDELVHQLATLLSDLLPEFHRRVSFHDLLATAGTTPPGYRSLDELARVLAPFERPGREAIIRELYQRAAHVVEPVYTASFEPAALDRFVSESTLRPDATTQPRGALGIGPPPAFDPQTPQSPRRRFWQDQRVQAAVVVVLAVVIIGVCGRLLWALWSRPSAATAVQQQTSPTASETGLDGSTSGSDAASAAARNSAGERTRGAGTPAARQTAAANAPAFANAPGLALNPGAGSATGPTSTAASPGSSSAVGGAASGAPRTDNVAASASPVRQGGRQAAQQPAESAPGRGSGELPVDTADSIGRIYTASDREVTPPALTAYQQLWRIPASPRPEDTIRVEVVVDEQGNVESAKSFDNPVSLADAAAVAMSLSAAKSWHFRPAVRDGHPVRYRQVVSVSMR
jgi:hypothetical protein